ncbi:putative permease [delta proteobacterium NaphS2]|nr:putative permease [delta proteobacterium NaphS2]
MTPSDLQPFPNRILPLVVLFLSAYILVRPYPAMAYQERQDPSSYNYRDTRDKGNELSKRPDNILYWVNERPPLTVTLLMGLQHVFLMCSTLVLPVVIVRETGGTMTEIAGVVVLMVGVALIPLGSSKFLGINISGDPIDPVRTAAAGLPLLVMIGVNIWTKGRLRLYSVLLGMVVAYLASSLLGILDQDDWQLIRQAPWFALPGRGMPLFRYAFDWTLVVPFLVVSLCASLKTLGNLVTCQSINDAEWREADMRLVGNGLLAGMAVDTSSSNVGLSAATGVTSRWVASAAAGIFMSIAFCPKLTMLVGIMPSPAMGAILLFVTSFMIVAGMKIILTTPMDTRKTFIVGISIIFGLNVDILPEMYQHLHPWIKPLFSSSLTLATVMAILLNQLFQLGASNDSSKS